MPPPTPTVPPRLDPLAAFLSYLVPGLGQVLQGRVGKGLLFFTCLYGLFFYGMYLSNWRSVWLADCKHLPAPTVPIVNVKLGGTAKDLNYRKGFVAQFFIGAAAWPAVAQYLHTDPLPPPPDRAFETVPPDIAKDWQPLPHRWFGTYMQAPAESVINRLQTNGDKLWDLGWVFTVIAGILNVLVIYDALAGPVVREQPKAAGGAA